MLLLSNVHILFRSQYDADEFFDSCMFWTDRIKPQNNPSPMTDCGGLVKYFSVLKDFPWCCTHVTNIPWWCIHVTNLPWCRTNVTNNPWCCIHVTNISWCCTHVTNILWCCTHGRNISLYCTHVRNIPDTAHTSQYLHSWATDAAHTSQHLHLLSCRCTIAGSSHMCFHKHLSKKSPYIKIDMFIGYSKSQYIICCRIPK